MAKRSRTELKNIFRKGRIPGETDYHDLIDSMANLTDERMEGLPGGGLVFYEGPARTLMAFQDSPEADAPAWYIHKVNSKQERGLNIGQSIRDRRTREFLPNTRLFLHEGGGVGVDTPDPKFTLDVEGVVGMQCRVGTYASGAVLADGKWHDILPNDKTSGPSGYYALEVLAYTQSQEVGNKHSVSQAVCIGAFPKGNRGLKRLFYGNNLKGIRTTNYYYSKKRHRLQMRWMGSALQPRLELRSRRRMRGVEIAFGITSLFPIDKP